MTIGRLMTRAQSETLGALLITSMIVVLAGIVGFFVLSGVDTSPEPVTDVTVEVTEQVIRISHLGGDSLASEDVEVVFDNDPVTLSSFTEVQGDGDGRFEPGERSEIVHGTTGVISVSVVHTPTNAVLLRVDRDVPTDPTSTSAPTPTQTPGPTGTPTPTPTPESLTWSSVSDWDGATAEAGVVHDSYGDREAGRVELGYPATAPGLVGFWSLDEDDGSTASDASGTGNDGSIQGDPDLGTAGIAGSTAYNLDGTGDYVRVPDSASLEASDTDAVTVSAWVNKNTDQGGWTAIYQKSDRSYNLQLQNGNVPVFTVHDGGWQTANSGVTMSTGRWYHLVGTYDGSTARIYVDGNRRGTASATKIGDSGSADVGIGENLDSTGREIDARLDEVRVYDRSLSDRTVDNLSNTPTFGSITTTSRAFSAPKDVSSLELRNVQATRPSQISVTVESDFDGDATFEEASDSITLDGSGSHEITGLSTTSERFRLLVEFDSPSVTQSPTFESADLHSPR